MADSTNQTPSSATQEKLNGGFSYDPELGKNAFAEGPFPDYSQVIGGFNITSYRFPDGSNGLAIYNGKVALHFDNNNNITLAAGPPGQSGCGGKLIENVQSKLEKAGSIAIEVTGRPEGGTLNKEQNADGNTEETNLPAYSLKVYGPVYIEAIGGDCAIKGDNITLNASSTLNLKSNKDINIQAGENGGKINMYGGSFDLNTAFFNKKLSGGEFSDGSGEFVVSQNKPGASVNIETPGAVNYTVNGYYNLGIKGEYKIDVAGDYVLNIDKDYGAKILGDYANVIEGKGLTKVNGVKSKSTQEENYLLDVLATEKKGVAGMKISSGSKVEMSNTEGGFEFKVGEQAASMELDAKKFNVTTGAKMGAISIDEKQASMEFGKKQGKVSVGPEQSVLEWGTNSKVTVKASDVSIEGPMIYLN
jgi:hypothetical protein